MIIILHGPDSFRSREKLHEIVSAYRAKHGTRVHEARFDGGAHTWDDLRGELEGGSLFVEKRLIVMRNIHANKRLLESFLAWLYEAPQGGALQHADKKAVAVFWEDKKLGTTNAEKQLIDCADQCQEFAFLPPARLGVWAGAFAKKYHTTIDSAALALLIVWSGGNTWYLANEIRKLGAYARGRAIGERDVRALSRDIVESHIFQTVDAIFSGRTQEGTALLRRHLASGERPDELLGMFAREVRILAMLKGGSTAGLSPFVVKKTAPRAKNVSWPTLHALAREVYEADSAIKKGAQDPSAALELLGVRVSRLTAAP